MNFVSCNVRFPPLLFYREYENVFALQFNLCRQSIFSSTNVHFSAEYINIFLMYCYCFDLVLRIVAGLFLSIISKLLYWIILFWELEFSFSYLFFYREYQVFWEVRFFFSVKNRNFSVSKNFFTSRIASFLLSLFLFRESQFAALVLLETYQSEVRS